MLSLFFPQMIDAQNRFGYIGVESCGMCHKTEKMGRQLQIWKESKHSNAFETLKTERSANIVKRLGLSTSATESPECLKCHASGYNVDNSLIGQKFKIEDGVQCETCHGPGSDYKDMKIMKDRNLAVQKGLIVFENIETYCITCHNVESPTYIGFNFEEAWNKIKHPVPKTK
jgi:nitrate/TMAO reductase-like tetraheme cytochrome c subunit